jgi:hypothetical protein
MTDTNNLGVYDNTWRAAVFNWISNNTNVVLSGNVANMNMMNAAYYQLEAGQVLSTLPG